MGPNGGRIPSVHVVERLGPWSEAWDDLVLATAAPTPFAAAWWVDAGDAKGRTILLVADGDDLVGGLALALRRRAGIDVFGLLGSDIASPDHLDLMARPGWESAVADAAAGWFASRKRWLLRGEGLREDSLLARALGPGTATIPFSTAPFLPLPADGVPPPSSSRVRNSIRRTRNRLARAGLEHRRIGAEPGEFDRALADLDDLHRRRWPDGSNFAATFDELAPVLRAGARVDRVGIHELVVDGVVGASMLVLDLPDRRCYYQSGRRMDRDWRGAGSVLMAEVIEDAHRRGFDEFDFLRGREPYKLDWTDQERVLVRLFASRGLLAGAWRSGLSGFERAKPVLRRVRDRIEERRSAS